MAKPRIIQRVIERQQKKAVEDLKRASSRLVPIQPINRIAPTKKVTKPIEPYSGIKAFEEYATSTAKSTVTISKPKGGVVKRIPTIKFTKTAKPKPPKIGFTKAELMKIGKLQKKYGIKYVAVKDLKKKFFEGNAFEKAYAERILKRYENILTGQFQKEQTERYINNYLDAMRKANAPKMLIDMTERWMKQHNTPEELRQLPDIPDLAYPSEELGVNIDNTDWYADLMSVIGGAYRPEREVNEEQRKARYREYNQRRKARREEKTRDKE